MKFATLFTDSNSFLQANGGNIFVGFDETKTASMRDTPTAFVLVRPGLTKAAGSVSMMSFERPGWYLRHYNSRLYLEPKVNPRNPESFDDDATFTEHPDTFYDDYVTFESANNPGHYMVHNGSEGIYIRQQDGTADFNQSASFVAMSTVNERSKRAVAPGEMMWSVPFARVFVCVCRCMCE